MERDLEPTRAFSAETDAPRIADGIELKFDAVPAAWQHEDVITVWHPGGATTTLHVERDSSRELILWQALGLGFPAVELVPVGPDVLRVRYDDPLKREP